ncbi:MAG: hypothetical protein Q8P22_04070 [Chloroflexota bacterium]|nr:hypothetical protein [Chloroflexota bacterium]
MPITPNVRTKMKAALDAIETDAPNLFTRLTLLLARTNTSRATAGDPPLTMAQFVINSLVDNALVDDWQKRAQELEALKRQEAQAQLEADMQALKEAL